MQNLALYYSDSLLSAYLDQETLVSEASLASEPKPFTVPQIAIAHADDSGISHPPTSPKAEHNDHHRYLTLDELTLNTGTSTRLRMSVISQATSYNSLYSSVSENSEDLDLQSVRLKLDKLDLPEKQTRLGKFKSLFKGKEKEEPELDEDAKFMAYVCQQLRRNYYFYEKTSTLNVPWAQAAEVFYFGEPLDNLFTLETHIINYLMQSTLELGEPRFSNLNRFHTEKDWDALALLEQLAPNLARFNDILDLYAESDANISRPELFELFSGFANHSDGLCIPLAIAMFGRWLLAYNRDTAVESNYQNTLILNFFRKAARMALALEKVKHLFEPELDKFDGNTKLALSRYLNKDNKHALSISLHSLGEYFQYEHNHDVSVTLWEVNCHLTLDSESGNLAILGLTDGCGFGNHIKEHNGLGKRSKTHKFNTKRRIAHLYRILMKQPGFDEYGVSWATKEKYD